MSDPLQASVNPTGIKEAIGGRHFGPLPIILFLVVLGLVVAGIFLGIMSRFNSGEKIVGDQVIENPTPSASLEVQRIEFVEPPEPEPEIDVVEAVSIVLDPFEARKEEIDLEQRIEELSNRYVGLSSSPLIPYGVGDSSRQGDSDDFEIKRDGSSDQVEFRRVGGDGDVNKGISDATLAALNGFGADGLPVGQGGVRNSDRQLDFIKDQDSDDSVLFGHKEPITKFELEAGTILSGVMISGLNSELPGNIIGQISNHVYDTATGKYLLIPQGSRLFGVYDSEIAYGQSSALVAWNKIIFPNGSTLDLEGMIGSDKEGYSGFRDKVNNHYFKLFSQVFLLTAFQALSAQDTSGSGSGSNDDEYNRILAERTASTGEKIVERELAVQPTIVIRPGYQFSIMVNKKIVFGNAYEK